MTSIPQTERIQERSGFSRFVNRHVAWLMILPAAILVLALAIIPGISSVVLSFQDRGLTSGGGPVNWIGWSNYAKWLADPAFWNSVTLTIQWTVGSVALQLLCGLGVALLLHRKFRGRGLLRALVLIPWVLPIVSTANIWVWLYNDVYGIINTSLLAMGLRETPIPWLSSPDLSMLSSILVKTWREFPFAALLLMAGLEAIPRELYEAAKLDGANAWQQFVHVTLPGLRLVLLVILLLQTIWTFNDVSTVYLLTKGGPGSSTEILPILIYNTSFIGGDLSLGAAGAVLMFLIVAVLVSAYLRFYSKSEAELRQ